MGQKHQQGLLGIEGVKRRGNLPFEADGSYVFLYIVAKKQEYDMVDFS